MTNTPRRKGLTFVEVLVIAVVLGILLCLALVAILQLRVASRRTRCADHLATLGKGLKAYEEQHGAFPYATVVNADLPPQKRLSWYVGAWPSLGGDGDELSIDLAKPWDAAENRHPVRRKKDGTESSLVNRPKLRCPADYARAVTSQPGPTTYVGIAGIGTDAAMLPADDARAGIFGYDRQTRLEQITDGPGETMIVAETGLDTGPWTAGGRPTVRGLDLEQTPSVGMDQDGYRQFGGLHPKGANTLFAGGGVMFVSNAIDARVLAAMMTFADVPQDEDEEDEKDEKSEDGGQDDPAP